MAERRVSILVSEGLRDWLQEEAERLITAHEEGWTTAAAYNNERGHPGQRPISLPDMIEILLEDRRRHRQRRQKAAKNRKNKPRRPSRAAVENAGRVEQ